MKKYKVLEIIVFAIGKQEYSCKPGDVIELDENHITTRALIERKRIEESAEEQPNPDDAPEGKQEQPKPAPKKK